MKTYLKFIPLIALVVFIQGCMADIRTPLIKKEGITATNEAKGKTLLEKAWKKQGLDHLEEHQTYSFRGTDTWNGLLGKLGKVWPDAETDIHMRYAIGTFDSRVRFLNGKREGVEAGLQSWNYYEESLDGNLVFTDYNERIAFGLSAYQYFFELSDRLRKAPIISYAGEREFKGQKYDQVFVSWETPEPHQAHDQYVLWINRQTGLVDFAVYTIRDTFLKLPGSKSFYGSIQFADWQTIGGIMIPHTQIIYLNQPKMKEHKFLHRLQISGFAFDNFSLEQLYPNPELEKIGDDKLVSGQ